MISRTPETIEKIDGLILELISQINELEHDLRFQPHAHYILEEMKAEIMRLFKRHQSSFVKPIRKGWIY
jgi:hypothetical protein